MYHNPIFSKFLCMPTLKVTNVIGNFSLFSLRSTRQLMSTEHLWQRKKTPSSNLEEQTWPFLFLLLPTHIQLVWEKEKKENKRKARYFLCMEEPKYVLFSQSQASTFIAVFALHHKWQRVFCILLVSLRRGHVSKSPSAEVSLLFGCMQILQRLCNL